MALREELSTERTYRRRSLRIVMRVPLFVNPTDAPATAEWEPVETLVISLHGGMIRSRQQIPHRHYAGYSHAEYPTIHARPGGVDGTRHNGPRLRSRI